jgi:RimJ/RimL family protein N-acetyltransferase
MLQELLSNELERARSLFLEMGYSLSVQAAIEGNNPGRIFVDDPRHPSTGLALTVEGYLLAGESENLVTNAALHKLLKEQIFTGEIFVNGDSSMSLAIHPDSWEARLPELIPTHDAEKSDRFHYLCRNLKLDGRKALPRGYSIQRVDQTLLHESEVAFTDQVREWMDIEQMWGTEENFLAKGISYVGVYDREVVSWCSPDCVAGDQMDIGIFTLPAHRRKGVATAVVAATVEDCYDHGYTVVGWHCNVGNVASWKTAEKVGFERNREYTYYYYIYDIVDHLAELGWYQYRLGEYGKCVQYYAQVFALREVNPDYYYHLAASAWALIGNGEKALAHLKLATESGWNNAAYTQEQEEFSILHALEEWEVVLAQMEANRESQQ